MKTLSALFLMASLLSARCQSANLVPNGDFSAKNPLEGWRIDFPYEPRYVKNVQYIKVGESYKGGHAVDIVLPKHVAGMEGGKIESAFIKAEPGATYKVEIDCKTTDFGGKFFVEAWALDPKPISTPDKFRVPPRDGLPGLVMCYRADIPDPPSKSKVWSTISRELTIPATVRVGGQDEPPIYLSIKAFIFFATQDAGQTSVANFRLTKVN